jgi:hypothetical protein
MLMCSKNGPNAKMHGMLYTKNRVNVGFLKIDCRLFSSSKVIFDEHGLDIEFHASELKSRIETRSNCILAMIEKWLQIYQIKIDKYAESNDVIYREITAQFDSIDQRIQQYLKFDLFFSISSKQSND